MSGKISSTYLQSQFDLLEAKESLPLSGILHNSYVWSPSKCLTLSTSTESLLLLLKSSVEQNKCKC